MLQVGVNHSEQVRSRLTPAFEHRPRQTAFPGACNEANARIPSRPLANFFYRSVGASVIHYYDFVFISRPAQYGGDFSEYRIDRQDNASQATFQEVLHKLQSKKAPVLYTIALDRTTGEVTLIGNPCVRSPSKPEAARFFRRVSTKSNRSRSRSRKTSAVNT